MTITRINPQYADKQAFDDLSAMVAEADYGTGSFNFTPNKQVRFDLFKGNETGSPPDSWGVVLTVHAHQLAFGGNSGKVYVRRNAGNTWSSWSAV